MAVCPGTVVRYGVALDADRRIGPEGRAFREGMAIMVEEKLEVPEVA